MLQDFEALTPNLLARTIETVEGGGLIILLLHSLSSLTSLYTMVMVSFILPLYLPSFSVILVSVN
jgi:tRNA(Met) C34 N-acetyltransferase TmcA